MSHMNVGYILDLLGEEPEHKDTAKLIIESRSYVDALPRDALGTLAVDHDLLVFRNAWQLYSDTSLYLTTDKERRIPNFLQGISRQKEFLESDIKHVDMEIAFWKDVHPDGAVSSVSVMSDNYSSSWKDILSTVYEFPEILPYFEVGIMDTKFVLQCIDEGIDPSIALDLRTVPEASTIIEV